MVSTLQEIFVFVFFAEAVHFVRCVHEGNVAHMRKRYSNYSNWVESKTMTSLVNLLMIQLTGYESLSICMVADQYILGFLFLMIAMLSRINHV
jgi:hypothetical protein